MTFSKRQFIFFGLVAHLLAAIFSIGAHQCDEIFQIYEFAGYKLGMNAAADLPWEFSEQMRSGIQPFIVYAFTIGLRSLSVTNPFSIAIVLRIVQTLFSFFVLLRFLHLVEKEMRSSKYIPWLYGFSLLFWCIPYFHARLSSENFSATLFLFGLTILLESIKESPTTIPFLLAGFLFGLAFECRFQTAFMVAGLFLWLLLIRKISFKFIFISCTGFIAALGLGLLADYWLYDEWVLSWWNYLDLNLFKDKASQFGREPIWFFLIESIVQLIPPFSLIIIWCVVGFWTRFKTHVLTWITLPFILLHFFVAHKELRFLFPILNFLPFMILYYFQSVENYPNRFITFFKGKFFIRFAVTVNMLILIYYIFKPANNSATILKKLYAVSDEKPLTLLYEGLDPYSNQTALNYFKNPLLKSISIKEDSVSVKKAPNLYYWAEALDGPDLIVKRNLVFVKQYSSYPAWLKHLDFNGWLERSDPFTLYKAAAFSAR